MVGLKRQRSWLIFEDPPSKRPFRQSFLPDALSRLLSAETRAPQPEVSCPSLVSPDAYASLGIEDPRASRDMATRQLQVRGLHSAPRELRSPRSLYLVEPDHALSTETLCAVPDSRGDGVHEHAEGSDASVGGSRGSGGTFSTEATETLCTDPGRAAASSSERAWRSLVRASLSALRTDASAVGAKFADTGSMRYESMSDAEMFTIDPKTLRGLRHKRSRFKWLKVW